MRLFYWFVSVTFLAMLGLGYAFSAGWVPSWLYWLCFCLYIVGMGVFFAWSDPARRGRAAWRTEDSRRTEGRSRGTE